MGNSNQGETQP
ncbi:hypothetical protein YPPY32_4688, partial [Yersinia pestis PY-32]